MKPIVCIFCEGNDTKIAVLEKDKEKIKVLKTGSFNVVQPPIEVAEGITNLKMESEELSLEELDKADPITEVEVVSTSGLALISTSLKDINLNNSLFIPILTEPAVHYHVYEGSKLGKSKKFVNDLINDISETKNITVSKDELAYVELADKSSLAVFLSGEVSCIKLVSSLAGYNGKRFYKIPTIKSAEVALANYIAKKKKFFPDDQSLIVYIGKEYSKLIFLQGRKLKHIGTTLDIGTTNLHTYDVYFSKILLEMDNGGISSLDNIIVCGEDDSENLILSFYGTFPEANVSRLEFDDLNISLLDHDSQQSISAYSILVATANEFFDDQNQKQTDTINLLPRYVREDQKVFQFAWHGYAILPLLFGATFFLTLQILMNNRRAAELDKEIAQQTVLLRQNQEILGRIAELENKISGFGQTQTILDSAAVGTGVWSKVSEHFSDFFGSKQNIWLTKLNGEGPAITVEGYALSKLSPTELAYSITGSELKGIFFESIRESDAYRYNLNFNLSQFPKVTP
ncbi:MAG: hypothetical protein HXY50_08675 [Ignavibacteriaceae bacterium]|nr:hypothetical protein [Ignavibacteriaceae bacterium]